MGSPPILCLMLSIFLLVACDESSIMYFGTLESHYVLTEEKEMWCVVLDEV